MQRPSLGGPFLGPQHATGCRTSTPIRDAEFFHIEFTESGDGNVLGNFGAWPRGWGALHRGDIAAASGVVDGLRRFRESTPVRRAVNGGTRVSPVGDGPFIHLFVDGRFIKGLVFDAVLADLVEELFALVL